MTTLEDPTICVRCSRVIRNRYLLGSFAAPQKQAHDSGLLAEFLEMSSTHAGPARHWLGMLRKCMDWPFARFPGVPASSASRPLWFLNYMNFRE